MGMKAENALTLTLSRREREWFSLGNALTLNLSRRERELTIRDYFMAMTGPEAGRYGTRVGGGIQRRRVGTGSGLGSRQVPRAFAARTRSARATRQ